MSSSLDFVRQVLHAFEAKHGRMPNSNEEIEAIKLEAAKREKTQAALVDLIRLAAEDPGAPPEREIVWKQA